MFLFPAVVVALSSAELQRVSDGLVFILQAPGNCLSSSVDLPATSPSKNMAALWLRASFHDSATWTDNLADSPGCDASLLASVDENVNLGIKESLVTRFTQNIMANISNADAIAIGGQITIAHCGGPNIPFASGRVQTTNPTTTNGPIPEPDETFTNIMAKMTRMGFNNLDVVALVTGSHSLGGIHAAISPMLTNQTFVPFDNTPGVFDNDVFKRTLNGICPVPFDCQIANDPVLRVIVQRFANDQNEFFRQYVISYQKMIGHTTAKLSLPMSFIIPLHANLLAEGTTNNYKSSSYSVGSCPNVYFMLLTLLILYAYI